MKGYCYLIHFDNPINPLYPALHYLGWTVDVDARFALHASGQGAKLCRAANSRGIGFRIVRLWENVGKDFERSLKKRRNAPKLCPVCLAKHTNDYPQWVQPGNVELQRYSQWIARAGLQVAYYNQGQRLDAISLADVHELAF